MRKSFKKIGTLVLAACMCFSLAACGDKEESSSNNNGSSVTTEKPASTDSGVDEFALGTVSGSTYTSTTFGFTITIPDGWQFYGSDILASQSGMTQDKWTDADVKDHIANGLSYCIDCFAQDMSTGSSINLSITRKQAGSEALYENLDNLLSSMETVLKQQMESAGYTVDSITVDKATFMGKEQSCLNITLSANGATLYERQFYVLSEHYLCAVTVGTLTQSEIDTIAGFVK